MFFSHFYYRSQIMYTIIYAKFYFLNCNNLIDKVKKRLALNFIQIYFKIVNLL